MLRQYARQHHRYVHISGSDIAAGTVPPCSIFHLRAANTPVAIGAQGRSGSAVTLVLCILQCALTSR